MSGSGTGGVGGVVDRGDVPEGHDLRGQGEIDAEGGLAEEERGDQQIVTGAGGGLTAGLGVSIASDCAGEGSS